MSKPVSNGSQPIDHTPGRKQKGESEREAISQGESKATDTVETLFGKVEAARIRTKITAKRSSLQKANELKLPKEELVSKVVSHLENIEKGTVNPQEKELIAQENNLVELIALIEYAGLPDADRATLLELIETGITVMAQSDIANQPAQALATGVKAAGKQVMLSELIDQLEKAKTPEEVAIVLHSNMDKLSSRQKKFVELVYDFYVGADSTIEALKRPSGELAEALSNASFG